MQKRVRKSIYSILLSLLLVSSLSVQTFAAPQQNYSLNDVVQLEGEVVGYNEFSSAVPYATSFADASITISYDSEGMYITICTGMNGIASVVGVKDIEIQKKVLFGWDTVAVSSGGESYDVTTSVCSIFYDNAVEGETYRVRCVHYGDVDGYREMEAVSGGFKYVI